MKKKVVIVGTCVLLFLGAFSSQLGSFQAGTEKNSTGKKSFEYYYNEDDDGDNKEDLEKYINSVNEPSEMIQVETNPDSYAVLVNRDYLISKDYVPGDLVVPNIAFSFYGTYEKSYMRQKAADQLEKLFAAAQEAGFTLKGVSAYRSYERQMQIYNNNVRTRGTEKTDKVSAIPGSSEHQTGLAIDVSCNSAGCALEESFGSTEEGKWLRDNCHKFGFIIRYPKGKEDITGYSYEPWHIRYVGKKLAKYIFKNHYTLEEYYKLTTVDNQIKDDFVSDMDDTEIDEEEEVTSAPTPKPTSRAVYSQTPAPAYTSAPQATRRPAATEKPLRSSKPRKTPKPQKSSKPLKTPDKATPKPATPKPATQEPIEDTPAATEKPRATKTPAATKTPEEPSEPETSGPEAAEGTEAGPENTAE